MNLKENEVFYPWRRYLARSFDSSLYQIIWLWILFFTFHVNFINLNGFLTFLNSFVGIIIMIFLEPLLLHLFGTTLGKLIFGLHIESEDGSYPSYKAGLARTWNLLGVGMGYCIPILHLVMLWKSYIRCTEKTLQPWENEIYYKFTYRIKDKKWYRGVFFVIATIGLIFLSILPDKIGIIPSNRGPLTVAEFAENYNKLADYYMKDNSNRMNADGTFKENDSIHNENSIELYNSPMPTLDYIVENDKLTGIQFNIKSNNQHTIIDSYSFKIMMVSLAYASPQKISDFFKMRKKLSRIIDNHTFEDFTYNTDEYTFVCNVTYSGYESGDNYLFPNEDETNSFDLVFSITKQ